MMKITAIGVNSAFATGSYDSTLTVAQVQTLLAELLQNPEAQQYSETELQQQIETLAQTRMQPKWQSNFLIEFDTIGKRGSKPYRLLVDVGGDVRHALKGIGLSSTDIDGVYISHPHADHIGGMEYIALTSIFNPFYTPEKKKWLADQFIADKLFLEQRLWAHPPANAKPDLFVHRKVLEPLERAIGPGLDTLQGVPDVTIHTYFDVHLLGKKENGLTSSHIFQDGNGGEWKMIPVFAMHVISSSEEMASYGICLEHSSGYNVLMPTDTQHMIPKQLEPYYKRANRIYMDCETSPFPSGVHPHISNLINDMSPEIQRKCLLYHYDSYPQVPENMFYGVLNTGDSHHYPE